MSQARAQTMVATHAGCEYPEATATQTRPPLCISCTRQLTCRLTSNIDFQCFITKSKYKSHVFIQILDVSIQYHLPLLFQTHSEAYVCGAIANRVNAVA